MRLPHRWMAVATIALTVWIAKGARNMPILACFLLCIESAWFMPSIERTILKPPSIIEHFDGPVSTNYQFVQWNGMLVDAIWSCNAFSQTTHPILTVDARMVDTYRRGTVGYSNHSTRLSRSNLISHRRSKTIETRKTLLWK